MRRFTVQVFDEYISGTVGVWYSSSAYNDSIGAADSILVQAVTEEVAGTLPGIVVQPEYSANGLDWLPFPGNLTTLIANDGTYLADSAFFAGAVFLTFLRLKVTLTGGAPACYLKLFVCGRVSSNAVTALPNAPSGVPQVR